MPQLLRAILCRHRDPECRSFVIIDQEAERNHQKRCVSDKRHNVRHIRPGSNNKLRSLASENGYNWPPSDARAFYLTLCITPHQAFLASDPHRNLGSAEQEIPRVQRWAERWSTDSMTCRPPLHYEFDVLAYMEPGILPTHSLDEVEIASEIFPHRAPVHSTSLICYRPPTVNYF
jgi:hypothetical protein